MVWCDDLLGLCFCINNIVKLILKYDEFNMYFSTFIKIKKIYN